MWGPGAKRGQGTVYACATAVGLLRGYATWVHAVPHNEGEGGEGGVAMAVRLACHWAELACVASGGSGAELGGGAGAALAERKLLRATCI